MADRYTTEEPYFTTTGPIKIPPHIAEDTRKHEPVLISTLILLAKGGRKMECTRINTVKVPRVQLRVVLLLMLFMLCKSAECFSWHTSLSTSRGEKSIIIHVFLSFIYWAQKLKKYTVSIELNWNITLFLFHGVIQFSINMITYQYLSKTSLYLTT